MCTLALSRYLDFPTSPVLAGEVDRVVAEGVYEPTVFFVRNQGYVEPTEARRISFADALAFEKLHEQTYLDLGFQLVEVPAGHWSSRPSIASDGYRRRHGEPDRRAGPRWVRA